MLSPSFPLWERGLKLAGNLLPAIWNMSFPLWERGLKHALVAVVYRHLIVVPLVGTWIETSVFGFFDVEGVRRSPCGNVD